MSLKTFYSVIAFALFLSGCSREYEYWDMSQFKIDSNALSNNEPIKIIYSSRGPDYNQDLKYYIHIIAVSQKTGDTVNILTTAYNEFQVQENAAHKTYNFFNLDSDIAKIMLVGSENIPDGTNLEKMEKPELPKIDKVARDPAYDYIADNQHPSIIGFIGTTSKNSEQ